MGTVGTEDFCQVTRTRRSEIRKTRWDLAGGISAVLAQSQLQKIWRAVFSSATWPCLLIHRRSSSSADGSAVRVWAGAAELVTLDSGRFFARFAALLRQLFATVEAIHPAAGGGFEEAAEQRSDPSGGWKPDHWRTAGMAYPGHFAIGLGEGGQRWMEAIQTAIPPGGLLREGAHQPAELIPGCRESTGDGFDEPNCRLHRCRHPARTYCGPIKPDEDP